MSLRSRGGALHSDLELPDELKEFWFPVAFSSQLKEDAMVTMELFGEPWVMFRDAQGLAACVKDACAHRACPLSLVRCAFCFLLRLDYAESSAKDLPRILVPRKWVCFSIGI